MSVMLFRTARWISLVSFLSVGVFSFIRVPEIVIFSTVIGLLLSILYIVLYRCGSCGNSYSTKKGLISVFWPYTSQCRNCGAPLGGTRN